MEGKYLELKTLCYIEEVISHLLRQQEAISRGVRNRAYTVRELAEDNRLEEEINKNREEYFRRRKAFAKKFQSMQEIDDLSAFIEDKNKDNHDEREMSKLKGIVREVKEDFKEIKQENREER